MTIRVDVLDDGGIRIDAPGVTGGIASLRMATGWMQVAADRGYAVVVTGNTDAPPVNAVIDAIRRDDVSMAVTSAEPAPWPRQLTSLQVAASSGLDEQVSDLLARGADPRPSRRDRSPYRLAMRAGHVGVLEVLRDAGVRAPSGSRPPADLPDAVVFRNYLPDFTRWLAIAAAVAGIVLAIVVRHWAFLIVAAFGIAAILVGNAIIGRTRIAVDGSRLSVRQVVRWQGPIDLRSLVAVGYSPAVSRRMSSRWRFVQTQAGERFGRLSRDGFDPGLVDTLAAQPDLRVVTVYSGRGFLSPGFERHVATNVVGSPARLSTTAQSALDAANRSPRFADEGSGEG